MLRPGRLRPQLYALRALQAVQPVVAIAHSLHADAPWRHVRFHAGSRREPSVVRLLLAGLAVVAFVGLLSAANRRKRSRAETLLLGVLLLAVGAIVMSFRRSARRFRS